MTTLTSQLPAAGLPRRTFLRVAGASAATVGLVLAGCGKDPVTPTANPNTLRFGTTTETNPDRIVLNYLFLVKQLEYAVYNQALKVVPADVSATELAILTDLRDHELVHRQVLADVLGSAALGALAFDFSSVSLNSRAGILAAARRLEDTGAGALLGALPLLRTPTLFALVAKMASVEARHAAQVRELLTPGTFADDDVVASSGSAAGQALALTPTQVVAVVAPFLPGITISTAELPTA